VQRGQGSGLVALALGHQVLADERAPDGDVEAGVEGDDGLACAHGGRHHVGGVDDVVAALDDDVAALEQLVHRAGKKSARDADVARARAAREHGGRRQVVGACEERHEVPGHEAGADQAHANALRVGADAPGSSRATEMMR
jgi:hypothetical protein